MHAETPGPHPEIHHHPDLLDVLYVDHFVPARFSHPDIQVNTNEEKFRLHCLQESLDNLANAVVESKVNLSTHTEKLHARATLAESSAHLEALLEMMLDDVKEVDGPSCDAVTQFVEGKVAGLYMVIMEKTGKRSRMLDAVERIRVSKLRKPIGKISLIGASAIGAGAAAKGADASAEASFVGGFVAGTYLLWKDTLRNTVRNAVRNVVGERYNNLVKPVSHETKCTVEKRQEIMGIDLDNHQLVKLTRYVEVEKQIEAMHDKIWSATGKQILLHRDQDPPTPAEIAHTIRTVTEKSIRHVLGLEFENS